MSMCRSGRQHVKDDKLETEVIKHDLRIWLLLSWGETAKPVCAAAGLATRVWGSIVLCLPDWPSETQAQFVEFRHRQRVRTVKNLGQLSAHHVLKKTQKKMKEKSLRLYIDIVSAPPYIRMEARKNSRVSTEDPFRIRPSNSICARRILAVSAFKGETDEKQRHRSEESWCQKMFAAVFAKDNRPGPIPDITVTTFSTAEPRSGHLLATGSLLFASRSKFSSWLECTPVASRRKSVLSGPIFRSFHSSICVLSRLTNIPYAHTASACSNSSLHPHSYR